MRTDFKQLQGRSEGGVSTVCTTLASHCNITRDDLNSTPYCLISSSLPLCTMGEATCHQLVVNKLNFADMLIRVSEEGKGHHTIRPVTHNNSSHHNCECSQSAHDAQTYHPAVVGWPKRFFTPEMTRYEYMSHVHLKSINLA